MQNTTTLTRIGEEMWECVAVSDETCTYLFAVQDNKLGRLFYNSPKKDRERGDRLCDSMVLPYDIMLKVLDYGVDKSLSVRDFEQAINLMMVNSKTLRFFYRVFYDDSPDNATMIDRMMNTVAFIADLVRSNEEENTACFGGCSTNFSYPEEWTISTVTKIYPYDLLVEHGVHESELTVFDDRHYDSFVMGQRRDEIAFGHGDMFDALYKFKELYYPVIFITVQCNVSRLYDEDEVSQGWSKGNIHYKSWERVEYVLTRIYGQSVLVVYEDDQDRYRSLDKIFNLYFFSKIFLCKVLQREPAEKLNV
jgi:hypothetical protein